jgi:predicted DNA-binding ribbon-helix-helix protein
MKSPVIKRSIVIAGHKTSVSLEDAFWKGLKDIASAQRTTLSDLVAAIDTSRRHGNLSSAIRLFVLDHFQARTDGGADVGHDGDRPAVAAQQAEANRPPRAVALERV